MRESQQLSFQIADRANFYKIRGDGHLSWAGVLRSQDWGSILSNVLVIIALILTNSVAKDPRDRPFLLYDATISFPNSPDIIPYWVAVFVPLVCMLLTFAVAESRRAGASPGLKRVVASLLHLTLDGIFAFVVTAELTQVAKVVVGRLRPDYLARCNPAEPASLDVQWGLGPGDNPVCRPTVSEGQLRDGRYSFPSGHTSTVFVFAVYSVAYGVWALSFRDLPEQLEAHRRGLRNILRDALFTALTFFWLVAQLSFAWGVGISRVVDYHHHPSDVVAGALLGTGFGLLYAARGIARLAHVAAAVSLEAQDRLEDPGIAPSTP